MLSPDQFEFIKPLSASCRAFGALTTKASAALACCVVLVSVLSACDMDRKAKPVDPESAKPLSSNTSSVETNSAETKSTDPVSADSGSVDVIPMQPVPVKVIEKNGAYQLYRGGEPYEISSGRSVQAWRYRHNVH